MKLGTEGKGLLSPSSPLLCQVVDYPDGTQVAKPGDAKGLFQTESPWLLSLRQGSLLLLVQLETLDPGNLDL